MSDKNINILFSSAGRRVELIRLFKSAYIDLKLFGKIVATDIDPLAPSLKEADCFYLVPKTSEDKFIPTITEICKREKINLVFPLIDPDILVLSRSIKIIEGTGAKLITAPKQSAEITADKWLTYELLKKLNVPTPSSWLPREIEPSNMSFPVFIKPRFGSASKFTFKVNSESALNFFCEYVPSPVIQEYLPGPEITNDVICSLKGEVLAVVSRRRIEVRWGEVAKGVTIYDQKITEDCIRIAKELQAIGPITVQCIVQNGTPYFTEINHRYGGGAPLGIMAGVNSPLWLLAEAADLPFEVPPVGTYKIGRYMTRFDDSFFFNEADRERMESHHI